MLFICLYHGELYSDLWKSYLYFRPAVSYCTVFNVDFDSLTPMEIYLFFLLVQKMGIPFTEVFDCNLGTGDYGHITIEHASMLFRKHLSLREYLNQGFEAADLLQRQLYSKATSHDRHGHATSS